MRIGSPRVVLAWLGVLVFGTAAVVAAVRAPVALPDLPAPRPRLAILGRTPVAGEAIVAGHGSLWVGGQLVDGAEAEEGGVIRVDPMTSRILAVIESGHGNVPGGARDIAIGPSGVWAANPVGTSPPGGLGPGDPGKNLHPVYDDFRLRVADLYGEETTGGIMHIDPRTNRLRKLMMFVDHIADHVAVDGEGAWFAVEDGIVRIDPDTYEMRRRPRMAPGMLVADGSRWRGDEDAIVRVDERGRVTRTIPVPGLREFVLDGTTMWASADDGVARLDLAQGRIVARIPVEDPWGIAAADGVVLVTSLTGGTLSRIDPATNLVVDELQVGGEALGPPVLIAFDSAWVLADRLYKIHHI